MKKILIFLILSLTVFSKDVAVSVNEVALNKFLTGLGAFTGDGQVDIKITKFAYTWKIYEGTINLIENGSKFEAKVDVMTEGKVRTGTVVGETKFSYDKAKQELVVDITNLKFRGLDLFNLAGFYKPSFTLPVELFKNDKIVVKKNDKESVTLVPTIYEEEVRVTENDVIVEGNIKFEEIVTK